MPEVCEQVLEVYDRIPKVCDRIPEVYVGIPCTMRHYSRVYDRIPEVYDHGRRSVDIRKTGNPCFSKDNPHYNSSGDPYSASNLPLNVNNHRQFSRHPKTWKSFPSLGFTTWLYLNSFRHQHGFMPVDKHFCVAYLRY